MKFRKRALEIEAIQWTGKNAKEVKAWIFDRLLENGMTLAGLNNFAFFIPRRSASMSETLWQNIADDDWSKDITAAVYDMLHETYVGVKTGQWIICGLRGEFYPHDEDLFPEAYEPV